MRCPSLFLPLIVGCLALGATSVHAQSLQVLRSDARVLELEWTMPAPTIETVSAEGGTLQRPTFAGGHRLAGPNEPDVPSVIELVGIPRDVELPRIQVVSVDAATMPIANMAAGPRDVFVPAEDPNGAPIARSVRSTNPTLPAETWPAQWAGWNGVRHLRDQRVANLELYPVRYDPSRGQITWARSLRVRVDFPATPARAGGPIQRHPQGWEELLDDSLLNAEAARTWRKTQATTDGLGFGRGFEDSFNSAPTWVRFDVYESGVYRLDYFTFQNLGVDPGAIDPRTIRVFAGRNLQLDESLESLPPRFMTECALKDLGDGDDVFDLEDRFLFYALDTEGWANEFDSTRDRTEFIENKYTDHTVYWVTWGGTFANGPKRMTSRSVRDTTVTEYARSAPWRIHVEQNNVENFRYRDEDGWMWEDLRGRGDDRRYAFDVPNPASGDGILSTRLYSYSGSNVFDRSATLRVDGTDVTYWQWCHGSASAVFDVTGCFEGLLAGGMTDFEVDVISDVLDDPDDRVFTGWFDLEYDRTLRAQQGRYLKFFSAIDAPAEPRVPPSFSTCPTPVPQAGEVCPTLPAGMVYNQTAFRVQGLNAAPTDIHLFDVSDQHAPVDLVDFTANGTTAPYDVSFADQPLSGTRWYVAMTVDAAKQLNNGRIANIRDLRAPTNAADYVVIHHPDFQRGAERLAAFRAGTGEGYQTMAISVDDVFQEFAWGMRDPVAIRNFLAWANSPDDGWEVSAPLYVVLVGDGAYDTEGYLSGSPTNFLSSYSESYRSTNSEYVLGDNVNFYSTDDFYCYLDSEDYESSIPGLDVAIGRYPVQTNAEFEVMLDKLEAYVAYESPGQWQNRVVLAADDERTLDAGREPFHTEQVEVLAEEWFPPSLDTEKVYLVEYPRNPFGKKPEAQSDFIEEFTRGALHVSYTGHGDQSTMAQEEVFVSQKVPELLNETRFPIFSTFSCTVSRFDLLSGDCMTELLLKHVGGGAVTTFSSGGLVFPGPSFELNKAWLGALYGTPYIVDTNTREPRPLGRAAITAKSVIGTDVGRLRNNEKYLLLGDPALVPRFGQHQIRFEPETVDSLTTNGLLRHIEGMIVSPEGELLDGTGARPPFNGTAWVHVTELEDTDGYDYMDQGGTPRRIEYRLEGVTNFRGQVPVTNGRFDVDFFISEGVVPGNTARISVFALDESGAEIQDASGSYENLLIAPTISPSQVQDSEGPVVAIRFEGYDNFIDGDYVFTDLPILSIELIDPSGINLRPFPQFARLEAELDGVERIDLADDFSYDRGDFTRGKVRRILPVAPGKHTLEVKAFDNVGNRGTAKIEFEVLLADSDFELVENHIAFYPNPFRGRMDLVYRLTREAVVDLQVFTITGRKIWETQVDGVAGDNTVSWNGRDENGLSVANGTYLVKMTARGTDSEGNAASDEFVGKVVRMQ